MVRDITPIEEVGTRDDLTPTVEYLEDKLDRLYEVMQQYPASKGIRYFKFIKEIKEEYGYKDVLRNGLGRHKIL